MYELTQYHGKVLMVRASEKSRGSVANGVKVNRDSKKRHTRKLMPRLTLLEQKGKKSLTHLNFTHHYPQYIWRHDYKVSAATEKDPSILAN